MRAASGGLAERAQRIQLSEAADVLVANPPRLVALLKAGAVRLDDVRILIVDEADTLLAPGQRGDIDTLLDVFVDWAKDSGLTLYSHQEEAILEVFADRHVVLNTPTGSGKSLVALAMHFKALATGRRSFYTSPIKALVSEKFFELCRALGGENVGMMTGDAAINDVHAHVGHPRRHPRAVPAAQGADRA